MTRAFYNEWDSYAADWLRNLSAAGHIAPGSVDSRSIHDVRPVDLAGFDRVHFFAGIGGWDLALQLAGWPADVPVWTGSCPCQPFSAAGKRGGFDDDRHLWPEFFRLISECRPAFVMGEQVASHDGLAWLDLVHTDLEGAGYAVRAADLCAAGVGAPHIRQRLWWVGVADASSPKWRAKLVRRGGDLGQASERHEGATHVGECVSPVRVADSFGPRLEGRDARALGDECSAAERGSAVGGMGDTRSAGSGRHAGTILGAQGEGAGEWRRVGRQSDQPVDAGADGRLMADADSDGLQGCEPAFPAGDGRRSADALRSPWSDLEYLPCRDGKARPTQPGLFPLAHGVSGRVGKLRAAGNAIVPQVGAAFVEAVMGWAL